MSNHRTPSSSKARGRMPFNTHSPASKAGGESSGRKMEMEDDLISYLYSLPPDHILASAAAVASCALSRFDHEVNNIPKDFREKIWVWPVSESDRKLVRDMQQQHQADPQTERIAAIFVDMRMDWAAIDEVVFAATAALQWAKHDARRRTRP